MGYLEMREEKIINHEEACFCFCFECICPKQKQMEEIILEKTDS